MSLIIAMPRVESISGRLRRREPQTPRQLPLLPQLLPPAWPLLALLLHPHPCIIVSPRGARNSTSIPLPSWKRPRFSLLDPPSAQHRLPHLIFDFVTSCIRGRS